MSLTTTEQELALRLAIDKTVLSQIKALTRAPLQRLERHTYCEAPGGSLGHHKLEGLFVLVPSTQARTMALTLRPLLATHGLLTGIIATHTLDDARIPHHFDAVGRWLPPEQRVWGLGILPGRNPVKLLVFLDEEYIGISRDEIRQKLDAWNKLCTLELLGVGRDWLLLTFTTLPHDLYTFATEVYALCEDVTGTFPQPTGAPPIGEVPVIRAATLRKTASVVSTQALKPILAQAFTVAQHAAEQATHLHAENVHALIQHLRTTHSLRLWWP